MFNSPNNSRHPPPSYPPTIRFPLLSHKQRQIQTEQTKYNKNNNKEIKQPLPHKQKHGVSFVLPTILGHWACPGVWLLYPVVLVSVLLLRIETP